MSDDERQETLKAFEEAVNMTPSELEKWLKTDESRDVGTGVGHDEGERILKVKHKKRADLTDDDLAHMKKVAA